MIKMTFLIYMIITIAGSSLVSAVSLHIGAAFVGFVLGKGDSQDSGAIKGPDYALGLLPGDRGELQTESG
jgi:hypothetical protein